ncbi:MAG: TonB-dependent receptor, partial [Acidobacteria bacterium]|nr:TonB-dependent receptor [Acidobacteriota bacterium]
MTRHWILAVLALSAFLAPAFAEEEKSQAPSGTSQASSRTEAPETSAPLPSLVERVRVAGRLPDKPEEASQIPAHVTVFTREEIQASGAFTVQEFLAMHSDFVVFDEVGNVVQSTADLRGFNTGSLATGALVTVDGVRVNEPDTDYVNFVLIPLQDVERIEVIRGSASALFGEGGLGGVINVVTRSGKDAPLFLASISGGSYDTQNYRLASGGEHGKFSYYGSFQRNLSSGYRENSDVRISAFQLGADYHFSDRQSFGLDLTAGTNHLNQPGALTASELAEDPTQDPFNLNDFSATDLWVPSLHYRLLLTGGFSLTSNFSYRSANEDGFNGGRSGQGSNFSSDRSQFDWTTQAAQETTFGEGKNQLVAGLEAVRETFDTSQTRTDSEGTPLPQSDLSYSVSGADSSRRMFGVFLQYTLVLNPRWSLTAGARIDEISLDSDGEQTSYDFSTPPPFVLTQRPTGGQREFSQLSPKLGFNFNPNSSDSFYAGYSRGFRAPTVIELFAFPGFFSNPDLEPVISEDYEAGWDHRFHKGSSLAVNAFWIDVKDEIFFVLTDPSTFTGTSLNLPETRRRGAVVTLASPLGRGISGQLSGTYTEATFLTSFDDANIGNPVEAGDELPQIPKIKISAKVNIPISAAWKIGLQDIYVGSQVLTSDLANVA